MWQNSTLELKLTFRRKSVSKGNSTFYCAISLPLELSPLQLTAQVKQNSSPFILQDSFFEVITGQYEILCEWGGERYGVNLLAISVLPMGHALTRQRRSNCKCTYTTYDMCGVTVNACVSYMSGWVTSDWAITFRSVLLVWLKIQLPREM